MYKLANAELVVNFSVPPGSPVEHHKVMGDVDQRRIYKNDILILSTSVMFVYYSLSLGTREPHVSAPGIRRYARTRFDTVTGFPDVGCGSPESIPGLTIAYPFHPPPVTRDKQAAKVTGHRCMVSDRLPTIHFHSCESLPELLRPDRLLVVES